MLAAHNRKTPLKSQWLNATKIYLSSHFTSDWVTIHHLVPFHLKQAPCKVAMVGEKNGSMQAYYFLIDQKWPKKKKTQNTNSNSPLDWCDFMSKYNARHAMFDEHCLCHHLPFSHQIPATLSHTYTPTFSYLTTHWTSQTLPERRHFTVSFIHSLHLLPSRGVWWCLHKVWMRVASFGTEIFNLRTKEKMNIIFFPHHHHSHVILYTHIYNQWAKMEQKQNSQNGHPPPRVGTTGENDTGHPMVTGL